jgi:RimJ/RimL family protein N-acetyltransferase
MKKILETDRLILRNFVMDDDKALLEIMSDGGMPHSVQFGFLDIDYARGFLNRMLESYKDNGFGLWAVVEKASVKLIGYCGIHNVKINEADLSAIARSEATAKAEEKPELAYRIYKKLWGMGFATEAATAVCDYAFDVLKLPEIVSCIAHDNERSACVAEKVGLSYWKEGVFKGIPCRVYRKINEKVTSSRLTFSPATQQEADYVESKLLEFNARQVAFTQDKPYINLNYVLKDDANCIMGGINATSYLWNIVYIGILWIDKPFRNHGYGSKLLNNVEAEAKRLSCPLIHLDTFDFQAKDFYLKHGYEVFGVLDDCPRGHTRYFMKKKL